MNYLDLLRDALVMRDAKRRRRYVPKVPTTAYDHLRLHRAAVKREKRAKR